MESLTHGRNWYILLEYSEIFLFVFRNNCSSCLFKFNPNPIKSIFESSFLPNRISNSAQISSFQRSSNSFMNRKRSNPRLRQKFMWRNPKSLFLELIAVVVAVFILEVIPPILDILVSQNLRPIRDVNRQRGGGNRRNATVSDVDGRNPLWDSWFGSRTTELRGGSGVRRVEEVGLVEIESGVATAVVRSVTGGKKPELGAREVTLTSCHQKGKEKMKKKKKN